MLDTIVYDRKQKCYTITHEEQVYTFPSGKKEAAFQFAVSLFEPALAEAAKQVIDHYPYLERVVWKAVQLVVNEGVETYAPPKDTLMAMVDSSDGLGRYAIQAENGYLTCQCEHFTSFAAPITETGSRYCKHLMAYHLYLVAREDRF